jgi:hypothetical protein
MNNRLALDRILQRAHLITKFDGICDTLQGVIGWLEKLQQEKARMNNTKHD